MIKSITAIERDGFNVRTLTVECEVPNKDFNLLDAIKLACSSFIKTEEGKAVYEYNCGCFNLADFQVNVPNSICEKFGFRKISEAYSEDDIDWDEDLVI